MGKIFIGNPYNVESEYEDDELTFIVEEGGPIEYEFTNSSIDSIDVIETTDSETTDDEDFFIGSSNDSEWMDDDSYVSETDLNDHEDDNDVIPGNCSLAEILPESISTLKTSDVESISNDVNPPIQEPPMD